MQMLQERKLITDKFARMTICILEDVEIDVRVFYKWNDYVEPTLTSKEEGCYASWYDFEAERPLHGNEWTKICEYLDSEKGIDELSDMHIIGVYL